MTYEDKILFEQYYKIVNIYSNKNNDEILNKILLFVLNSNMVKEKNNKLLSLSVTCNDALGNSCKISGMYAGDNERGAFSGEYSFDKIKASLLLNVLDFDSEGTKEYDILETFEYDKENNKCEHIISYSGKPIKIEDVNFESTLIEEFKNETLVTIHSQILKNTTNRPRLTQPIFNSSIV